MTANLKTKRSGIKMACFITCALYFAINTKAIAQQTNGLAGLHLKLEYNGSVSQCGIYFNSADSDKFDNYDAPDLNAIAPKAYLSSYTSDNVRTSVNSMGDYKTGKSITLFVKGVSSGVYHLSLDDINNIDTAAFNVFLVDKFKNDSLDIVQHQSYAFNIVTGDANSFGPGRFVLAVERKPLPSYRLISFTGQKVTGGVQVNWEAYHEGNNTGFVLQKQGVGNQFAELQSLQSNGSTNYSYVDHNPVTGSNVYRLQQSDINGNITYSTPVTIIFNNAAAPAAINIYPNPSKAIITINASALKPPINYTSNIYDSFGKIVGHRTINGDTWTEDITAYKTGIYLIELRGNDGSLIGRSRFIKTE